MLTPEETAEVLLTLAASVPEDGEIPSEEPVAEGSLDITQKDIQDSADEIGEIQERVTKYVVKGIDFPTEYLANLRKDPKDLESVIKVHDKVLQAMYRLDKDLSRRITEFESSVHDAMRLGQTLGLHKK